MIQTIEGNLSGGNKNFAIIVSRFNELITSKLLSGAQDCLIRHDVPQNNITVSWVPGAFEIPLVAMKLAETNQFHAVICLGAVIKGSTPHFDYVSNEVSKGLSRVALDTKVPTIFGVLTTNTTEQAIERAGTKAGNKGYEAAMSALEMANLINSIDNFQRKNNL